MEVFPLFVYLESEAKISWLAGKSLFAIQTAKTIRKACCYESQVTIVKKVN